MRTDVWRAMAGNPVRFLLSSWPWRSLAYVAGTVAVAGTVWALAVPLLLVPPVLLFAGVPIGALERQRLRLLGTAPIASPHGPVPAGVPQWVRRRAQEAATWRELCYAVALLSVLLVLGLAAGLAVLVCLLLLTLPVLVAVTEPGQVRAELGAWSVDGVAQAAAVAVLAGIPATIITLYGLGVLAGAQAELAKWLLAPTGAEMSQQVDELTRSRNRLVDAFEAERRRIERDLHDGAQQHLVLLTMNLGLAEVALADGDGRAAALVGEAHRNARLALAAIREQIRGIHPRVLTDFGLVEAVRELAERCPVPVEMDLVLPGRLPAAVESTAYFVVCEALTNVVRHAEATHIRVGANVAGRRLMLTVTDDGHGGADPSAGTGVRGLADRVAVMDGTLEITSPRGGPTVVRIELPCRSG